MLLLAATALEKVEKVPLTFWFKVVGFILVFVIALFVLRKVAHMNKIILTIIVLCIASIVGFQWIYERNEPEFLTPAVNVLAQFFPSKGAYGNKQIPGRRYARAEESAALDCAGQALRIWVG